MAKRDIDIRTEDGTAKAGLFMPAGDKPTSGVILYMDAFGPRPALDDMAERMTGWGYAVLAPDLFYRNAPYGPFDAKTAFSDEGKRAELMGIMGDTTQEKTVRDSAAFVEALSTEGVTGPIGTVGYCMGGGRAINAAANYPDRIEAAASFHGGGLASDKPDSPHRSVDKIKGRVYVGVAGVDKSFPPEQSAVLAEALRTAKVDHLIENYVGMQHGWTVSDHGVYDKAGADRHWARLETFFSETLG